MRAKKTEFLFRLFAPLSRPRKYTKSVLAVLSFVLIFRMMQKFAVLMGINAAPAKLLLREFWETLRVNLLVFLHMTRKPLIMKVMKWKFLILMAVTTNVQRDSIFSALRLKRRPIK